MPSFNVRVLTLEEAKTLYKERMTDDFPADELKPFSMIERALERGAYICYGAVDGQEIIAYAYFVLHRSASGAIALLDYYAVREDVRNKGIGGAFLKALVAGPMKDLSGAVLEVDDPDYADTPEERARRERRLQFYIRNGMAVTPVTATVFGVHFRLLSMPVGPQLSGMDVRRMYGDLYRAILPANLYRNMISIH